MSSKKTIWKYEMPSGKEGVITMPEKHTILNAQIQYGRVKIWAIVNPEDKNVKDVVFHLVGTGEELPPFKTLKYIATLQTFAGSEVNHLFEEV